MLTRKVNEIAGNSFTFMMIIIALAVISTCLTFSLVISQHLNKLEIILITLLLLSSVLGLVLFSYMLVAQVHNETERMHKHLVNEQNKSLFRYNLIKRHEERNDELEAENDSLRQKISVRDLLSQIDKVKDTPEKEKIQEPNTTAFNEDIFGAPDENQENK